MPRPIPCLDENPLWWLFSPLTSALAMYISESNLGMLSPSGRCAMWDVKADGYTRGEGVAAVILKPLSQAIADNDPIECVIRETTVNSDGHSATGLTVPSNIAQTRLIRECYERAGLDPINKPADRPQFFQAHGTGTQAGGKSIFLSGSVRNNRLLGSGRGRRQPFQWSAAYDNAPA